MCPRCSCLPPESSSSTSRQATQRHDISRGSILAYLRLQRRIWGRKPRLFSVPRAHRAPSWPGQWVGTRPRDWWRRWRSGSLILRPFWLHLLENLTRDSWSRDRDSSVRCWAMGTQSKGSRWTSPWAGRRQASWCYSARRSERRGTRCSPWACCQGCCCRNRLGGPGRDGRVKHGALLISASQMLRSLLTPLQCQTWLRELSSVVQKGFKKFIWTTLFKEGCLRVPMKSCCFLKHQWGWLEIRQNVLLKQDSPVGEARCLDDIIRNQWKGGILRHISAFYFSGPRWFWVTMYLSPPGSKGAIKCQQLHNFYFYHFFFNNF